MNLLEHAIDIVKEAGDMLISMSNFEIEEKTDYKNLVTSSDKAIQDFLINRLKEMCPEASFLCEEDDVFDLNGSHLFIIDPIDGTANFTKGFQLSAISVAYADHEHLIWGIVYNPFTKELFHAETGKGAYLNGKNIHVSTNDLKHSLVNIGTSPYYETEKAETFQIASQLMDHCMDIRRTGSAALDLCYTACGRCGLYFEKILSPWDFAAGMCIVHEAGGSVINWKGQTPDYTAKEGIIAGSMGNVYEFCEKFAYHITVANQFEKKLLFVYNPVSGKQMIDTNLEIIREIIEEAGYAITTYATSGPGDATEIIRQHGLEYDRVIVAGGDGTLQEAVNAAQNTDIILGYIPAGSTNDFASSLGIRGSLEEKIAIALSDDYCRCDLGSLNDKTFMYVACFGTLSDISYTASQSLKNKIGHAAYVIKGFQSFHGIDNLHLTVTFDDGQIVDGEFCYGMITNSKYTAGVRLNYAKDVALDDGKFEVVLIRHPHGPVEMYEVATDMIVPHENPNMIVMKQTSSLTIHCDTPIPWDLDGEYGGTYTDVEFHVKNKAVQIIYKNTDDPEIIKFLESKLVKSQF